MAASGTGAGYVDCAFGVWRLAPLATPALACPRKGATVCAWPRATCLCMPVARGQRVHVVGHARACRSCVGPTLPRSLLVSRVCFCLFRSAAQDVPKAKRVKPNVHGATAEFVGTMVIALATSMIGGNGTPSWLNYAAPFVVGFLYLGLTAAFAHVSGGYFNPALLLVAKAFKRITPVDMVLFLVAQIAGAFVGVAIGAELVDMSLFNTVGYGFTEAEAIFVEIAFGAILYHVYVLTVHPHRLKVAHAGNSFFPVAIGFTFVGLSAAARNISGGVFNPAVGLALQCVNDEGHLWYIYFWAPFVGAVLAIVVGAFTASRMPHTGAPYFQFGGAMLFEFFHTGALVAVTALVARTYYAGATSSATQILSPYAPIAIALFYGAQVYAGHRISGGHLNPAISLAVYLSQKYFLGRSGPGTDKVKDPKLAKWWRLLAYWTVQIVGGIIGGLVAVRMHGFDATTGVTVNFIPRPNNHSNFQEFVFEFAFVAAIVWVFLSTARSAQNRGNNYFGMAVTMAFLGTTLAYGQAPVSANPATGVGLILAADADDMADAGKKAWIYVLGPILGALIGTFVYRITNEDEFVPEATAGSKEPGRQLSGIQHALNEVFGMFFFALTIAVCAGGQYAVYTALAGASMLAAMIYCCAHNSGGHHNPAVTLGALLLRAMSWEKAAVYIIMHVIGAVLGATLGEYITDSVVTLQPQQGLSNGDWLCFLGEFLFTTCLVFSALATGVATQQASYARNAYQSNHHAMAVGWVVVAGGYAIGQFSGAGLNPGLTTGLMARNGDSAVLDKLWLYLLAQFSGSFAAAALMYICYEQDVDGVSALNFNAIRAVVAEFVGTYWITLTSALVLPLATVSNFGLVSFLAVGAIYLVTAAQFRGASGAHFNPAVTVVMVATNVTPMGFAGLLSYFFAQILGAIGGALTANVFVTDPYAPWVSDNDDTFSAIVIEFIAAIVICSVFLNVMHSKAQRCNTFFSWAVGFTYAAFGVVSWGVSMSGLNSAVATGLVVVNGTSAVADDLFVYWVRGAGVARVALTVRVSHL